MILPERCGFHDRGDRITAIHRPEQVHLGNEVQQCRVERTRFGVHRSTATTTDIGDQDVDLPPIARQSVPP